MGKCLSSVIINLNIHLLNGISYHDTLEGQIKQIELEYDADEFSDEEDGGPAFNDESDEGSEQDEESSNRVDIDRTSGIAESSGAFGERYSHCLQVMH